MSNTALGAPLKQTDLPENDGVLAFVTDWEKYEDNLLQGYVDIGPRPDCMGLGVSPSVNQLGTFARAIERSGGSPVYVVMPALELWKKYRLTKMLYGNPDFFISKSGVNLRRVRYTDPEYADPMLVSTFFSTYIIDRLFSYIRYISKGNKWTSMPDVDSSEDTKEINRLLKLLNVSELDGSLEITSYKPEGFYTPAFNQFALRVHNEVFKKKINNVGQMTNALWPLIEEFMVATLRSGQIPCSTSNRLASDLDKCRVFGMTIVRLWTMMSDKLQYRMLYGATYSAINEQSSFASEKEYIIQPNRKTCTLRLYFPPGTVIAYPKALGVTDYQLKQASELSITRGVFVMDSLSRDGVGYYSHGRMVDMYNELFKLSFSFRSEIPKFVYRSKLTSEPNLWMEWIRSQQY